MIPLMVLKREEIEYRCGKEHRMVKHFLLYDSSEAQSKKLINIVKVCSRDIGMEFGNRINLISKSCPSPCKESE